MSGNTKHKNVKFQLFTVGVASSGPLDSSLMQKFIFYILPTQSTELPQFQKRACYAVARYSEHYVSL